MQKAQGCTSIDAVEKIFLILGDIFSLVNSPVPNWYKYCREKHSSILLQENIMADLRSELEKVKDQVETVEAPKKLETLADVISAVADISEVVNGLSDTVVEIAESHNDVVEDLRNISIGVNSKPSVEDKDKVEIELKKAQTQKTRAETEKLEKELEESPETIKTFKRVIGIGVFVAATLFGLGALSDAMKD